MHTQIGLESLVQRGRSAFYNQLVALYQETLDALRDHPRHNNNDIWVELKKLKFTDRMTSIFTKQMGPIFKPATVEITDQVNAWCQPICTKSFATKSKGDKSTVGMMMADIERMYDDREAKLVLLSLIHI